MTKIRKLYTKITSVMAGVMLLGGIASGVAIQPSYVAAAAEGPSNTSEIEKFADDYFNKPEMKEQMAGSVVVVVKGDEVLFEKGYGYADVEKKIPVDPKQTVFRIASISKVVTSTAVMQLVEQGKIDLNKDINTYLGTVQIPNKTDVPLTMKHLLMNATGFDYADGSELSTTDLKTEFPLKKYVEDNRPTVIRKPGEFYRYDNLGFTIQGYAVEQVSGKPFAKYVQEHILTPLGMKNSDFRMKPALMEHLAEAYDGAGQLIPTYTTIPTELPAGGMLSTGSDMAKFMMAHLGGGKLGDVRILKQETAEEMHRPQLSIHDKLPNMAYGFEYSNQHIYNNRYVVEKGGDFYGHHSGMWFIPEDEVGVFVAINKDHEIRASFFEAFMDQFYPDTASQTALEPSKDSLTQYEGIYSDLRLSFWTYQIQAVDGTLHVKDPMGEYVFYEVEPQLFQDENGIRAAFKKNEQGEVIAFYYDVKSDSWAEKLTEAPAFTDVKKNDPYAPSIYHLTQLGVIKQQENGLFHPNETITREEFAAWLIRWLGIAPSAKKPVFTDTLNSPYVKEIQAAYEFGMIKGSDTNKFRPTDVLTRQEAASIILQIAGLLGDAPKEANLAGHTDSWALEGVRYVVAKQLYGPEITKNKKGAVDYRSKDPMLKQEAAALLSKFTANLF